MIHHSRVVCEDQQSERWYQMVGALLIDYRYVCARTERERMPIKSLTKCSVYVNLLYRNLSPDANLNLPHLNRLYKKFYLCPFL
jgi:hypothetical protein